MFARTHVICGFLAVGLLLTICPPAQAWLQIQSYSEAKHDRFEDNTDFIGAGYDFSGVGKTSLNGTWAIMISPSYFLSAEHWHPGSEASLTFYEGNDPTGPSHIYEVDDWSFTTSWGGETSDLWMGRLETPIDAGDNINYYPVIHPDFVDIHDEIFVYGKTDRVGRNTIDNTSLVVNDTRCMSFDFDNPGGVGDDEAYVISGDSGGPSFVVCDGKPALVGIHYANTGSPGGDGDRSYDSYVPIYIDQLNANMGGESVTVVPEPATLLLLCLGGLGIAARSHKRRSA